jgi:hypothetical protein
MAVTPVRNVGSGMGSNKLLCGPGRDRRIDAPSVSGRTTPIQVYGRGRLTIRLVHDHVVNAEHNLDPGKAREAFVCLVASQINFARADQPLSVPRLDGSQRIRGIGPKSHAPVPELIGPEYLVHDGRTEIRVRRQSGEIAGICRVDARCKNQELQHASPNHHPALCKCRHRL